MKSLFLFVFILYICRSIYAQPQVYRVLSIPVVRNGIQLRDPWVGGMDSPEFSLGDLNQDGIQDLFVFDRAGQRVITYLGNGGSVDTMFTYAPQYETLFPVGLNQWALLRDYNHDGVPDIFTHNPAGTMVFKGSLRGDVIQFDTVNSQLTYPSSPYNANIYTSGTDMPVIADISGHGGMDIITYDFDGGLIGYYENQTWANPGNPHYAYDSLPYQLVTTCWGKVSQDLYSNSMELNIDTITNYCIYGGLGPYQPPANIRHTGNSIYSITDPVMHTVDLLNGNIGYNDLMFLRNCSTSPLGWICEWDSVFPPAPCAQPMNMPSYPAAYGINISNDSVQDVLMAPNLAGPYTFASYPSLNVNNVWWYKGAGDTVCWFDYQNDSFLVHHMLDFGTNSRGVFYDFNGDGLTDIIVGNYGYYNPAYPGQYQSAIAYYQNTGTATSPRFTEVTLDYDSFSTYHLIAMSPAFGDLDGDGKDDLLIGDDSGYLYFFKNTADSGSSFPVMTTSQYFGLNVSAYAAPFICDVNGDSLNDIIVGGDNGQLAYYWNFGTKTNPMFSQDSVNPNFGNINVCPPNLSNTCFSQPFIIKDETGALLLYVGSAQGQIFEYVINADSLRSGTFNLVNANVLGRYIEQNITISVADLTNSGKMEYLIGTATGGLVMYSDSLWDSTVVLGIQNVSPVEGSLLVYPNPARDFFKCEAPDLQYAESKSEIYNILGQQVNAPESFSNGKVIFNSAGLASGFYVIRISDPTRTYTGKVLVQR